MAAPWRRPAVFARALLTRETLRALTRNPGQVGVRVSARVKPGRFSFVVLTIGRRGARLWIDGRRAGVGARRVPAFAVPRPSPLTFGGRPGVGLKHFAGTVDDIAVFSRPLQAAEIRRLWRAARSERQG